MKRLLPFVLMGLVLGSCSDEDTPTVNPTPDRTVLIYIAGENNLSKYANDDLKEMKTGSKSLTDKQQLIAYIDQADTITPPFFARIKDGQFVDSVSVEESITADPAILEKALRYMRTNYPAKSYGLVLWGHASGWLISKDSVAYAQSRAYGGDTGSNSSSSVGRYWMNIPSMARAIAKGMDGTPLTFIFGDCCSFGCVEVAYELRQTTDYIIGSPAEIPDEGAPYDLIVPDMFNTSTEFYKSVIDHYYNYYLKEYKNSPRKFYNLSYGDLEGYSVPLMAVKTSELGTLATATAELLGKIGDKLMPDGSFELTDKVCYAQYGNYRYSYDMYNILKGNTPSADFNNWTTAFWKAMPYHLNSMHWFTGYSQLANYMDTFDSQDADCGVLSMFVPNNVYRNTNPNWSTAIQQFQWNNIIRWQQYGW
ncbi:MAG: hypothetical protein IJJ56_10670 [Prevotella sp.]|nr:hypothetical protein [Prevotella sp.]